MEFDFDGEGLEPRVIPFKIKGQWYVLHEASESTAVQYQDKLLANATIDEAGKAHRLPGINKAEPWLVAACSFRTDDKGIVNRLPNGLPDPRFAVTEKIVNDWPSRIVIKLYREAKRISDIDQPMTVEDLKARIEFDSNRLRKLEEEQSENVSKNGQDATTVTSV